MSGLPWIQILNWALTVFFLVGFVVNTFAVKVVGPDYRRWGYPDWFHFVSGGLELAVALLLMRSVTRAFGVALGCGIMLAAIATVVRHREFRRAVPPLVVFVLLSIVGWTSLKETVGYIASLRLVAQSVALKVVCPAATGSRLRARP